MCSCRERQLNAACLERDLHGACRSKRHINAACCSKKQLSPNRAQLFVRNKNTVSTMGGTVALRSVNKKFSGELQFCS